MTIKHTYTVKQSKFHGGNTISTHSTEAAALRAAKKHATSCWSVNRGYIGVKAATCCCGGPTIWRDGERMEIIACDGKHEIAGLVSDKWSHA